MSSILLDLRYGFRTLVQNPSFSLVAIIALALGIGANTAVFSVLDAVLLRPMLYADADRLVVIHTTEPDEAPTSRNAIAAPDILDIRKQSETLEEIGAGRGQDFSLLIGNEPERVIGTVVTSQIFSMTRVPPLLGRTLQPSDDGAGLRAIVLSEAYWRSRFGGSPEVIGQTIQAEGAPAMIVGVMPQHFKLPDSQGLIWASSKYVLPEHPLRPQVDPTTNFGSQYLRGWARIKDGKTLEDAQAELAVIAARISKERPETNEGTTIKAEPVREFLFGDLRPTLLVLLGAVSFVLLAACANIANLLLARATARQREIAVRAAIGASRTRLAQQMITESLLLSVIGAAFGILFAYWAIPAVLSLSPRVIVHAGEIGINMRVLLYTFGATLLTGVIFGTLPAIQSLRTDIRDALQSGSHGGTSRGSNRARSFLVATEVAFSLVLLIAAGLMINGFYRLVKVDPGFRAEGLVLTSIALPQGKYKTHEEQAAFFKRALEQFQQVQGVESVGAVSRPPMSGGNSARTVHVPGQDAETAYDSDVRITTPNYFNSVGQTLLRGRDIADSDRLDTPRVAVINQRMAELSWPNEDPIGKTFIVNDETEKPYQVVGVVNNIKYRGLDDETRPEMYLAYQQVPWPWMHYVFRTSLDPQALAPQVREAVRQIDPQQALSQVTTMDEMIAGTSRQRRFALLLLSLFAAIALVLASVGIYGVISYSVAQRTREIGIRMALGATAAEVVRMVLRQGMTVTIAGVAAGLLGAMWLSRFLASMLFSVEPTDALTYSSVSLLLIVVALIAGYLPSRRAARVNPMTALRSE